MNTRLSKLYAFAVMLSCLISSCTAVKPYQRMHLNDKNMALNDHKLETFEINFQAYREGAAGANGGKVGGGCGCN